MAKRVLGRSKANSSTRRLGASTASDFEPARIRASTCHKARVRALETPEGASAERDRVRAHRARLSNTLVLRREGPRTQAASSPAHAPVMNAPARRHP